MISFATEQAIAPSSTAPGILDTPADGLPPSMVHAMENCGTNAVRDNALSAARLPAQAALAT